jgi:hemin uptake protein HemP
VTTRPPRQVEGVTLFQRDREPVIVGPEYRLRITKSGKSRFASSSC